MNKILKNTLILGLFLAIGCIVGFLFLRWPDFDFYSYHYFNGWAFLHNRINIDFMPCFFRSYFNPILDTLNYLSLEKLNNYPLIFTLFSGIKYGVFTFLAYKIFNFVFGEKEKSDIFSTIFCTIITAASPIILFCITFENTDIQIGILILLGLYIYLKNLFTPDGKNRSYSIFFAAFIIGLAVGLKYSCVSFAIGIPLATLCINKRIENTKKILIISMCGLFCGFLISGGAWMAILYYKFQNPMFPYMNNIFKSPKADFTSVLSADFHHIHPKTLLDFILYPLKNTAIAQYVSLEQKYFDLKNYLGFAFCLLGFILISKKDFEEKYSKTVNINILYFSLFIITFTYLVNLILYSNYRYILPLYAFVAIVTCMMIKVLSKKEYYNHILAIILLLFITSVKPVENRIPWRYPNNILNIQKLRIEKDATVICGNASSCFFAPRQSKDIKYLGFSLQSELAAKGYWMKKNTFKNHYYTNQYLEKQVKDVLKNDTNVYFTFVSDILGPRAVDLKLYEKSLYMYTGKKFNLKNCRKIFFTIYNIPMPQKIYFCKIKD